MAVTETVKSTYISNRDATPLVPTVASIAGGHVRSIYGQALVGPASTTSSYYPLVSVPSNARVRSVRLQSAALGTSCAANVGVYVPTQTNQALLALNSGYTGGAAISGTFFGSAVDVAAASGPSEIIAQSGTNTMIKQEQELWQALGLASDPGCMLDIGVKLSAVSVAGGLIGLDCTYAS